VNAQIFLDFLQDLKPGENITHLFLLGDIFDLWIADHQYFQERFPKIILELKRLKSGGLEIHYFEGNHDLYLNSFWQQELGIVVHSGPIHYSLGSLRLYLAHGDQIDKEDYGYRFLRWFLRTPVMKLVAHNLPGRWVARIGDQASRSSRHYTSAVKTITNSRAQKLLRDFIQKKAEEEDFDMAVTGHLHIFDDFNFEVNLRKVRSFNLGTWLEKPRILWVTPHSQTIETLP
jgi:UDP-2,3-diacylglucosamine hydrolase